MIKKLDETVLDSLLAASAEDKISPADHVEKSLAVVKQLAAGKPTGH